MFVSSMSASAQERTQALSDCAHIVDNVLRLECYDRLAASIHGESAQQHEAARGREEKPAAAPVDKASGNASALAAHWELEPESKRGTFVFRPHQENYLLAANYNRAPNDLPFRPFIERDPSRPSITKTEMKFQLGFKMKLLENIRSSHSDLWFGYTQQSFWQAFNTNASSPFRDTNYQPELMLVTPVDFTLLGLHGRFINIGLVHQSNGQPSTLSRSWNRIYAQAGMEKGSFTLLARAWHPVGGERDLADNPDILDYMGHGDLTGTYRWRGHEFSLLVRKNFRTGRGAAQIGWAFPLIPPLKGYVQAFSGYGQSLIDYNSNQTAFGIGFLLGF